MATNSVENILSGAKKTLEKANKFTNSVEGNPTSSFAPKAPEKPNIPQSHENASAPYSMAHKARGGVSGLAEQAGSEGAIEKHQQAVKDLSQ